ncbi:hypothetical protein ACFL12_00245 [Pseudomonadota bacterium]
MKRIIQVAISLSAIASPAFAQSEWQAEQARHYTACMNSAHTRPNAAFDDAVAWEGLGGGAPARHCALAALVELGHYFEAAQGLENLAQDAPGGAAFASQILVQSANAWIGADNPTRAREVANHALKLAPNDSGALLARAKALGLLGAFWEAADDLSQILYADPRAVDALVLRGAAYRQLGAMDLGLDDLNRALTLDPRHPEGLLERGIAHRLSDNKEAARADWRLAVEVDPDSEAARRATANLHKLDSGIE